MNYHKRYGYEPYYAQILDFTKMLFCFLYLEFMFQSIKKNLDSYHERLPQIKIRTIFTFHLK